jgi:hypothetical protein
MASTWQHFVKHNGKGMGEQRDYWRWWSEEARRGSSPLYARLATAIGEDHELRELAARARTGQPRANMLLAAAHFLLLRGADHPLRRFYPSCGGSEFDADPFPDFRFFVLQHRDAVVTLISSRVTSTNEVGRSSVLNAGLRVVATMFGMPLRLIELGPSAGLNLVWDRYGVRYLNGSIVTAEIGRGAPLVLDCELKGPHLPPSGPAPKVSGRVGLELNPVDLSNPDDRDWLRALIWPEHIDRMARFERAAQLFLREPAEIRAGDGLDLLPEALAEAGANDIVCVYHTIAVYQFGRERREALENMLAAAGLRRPIVRLSLEQLGSGSELPMDTELKMIRYVNGIREEKLLALSHPHGRWLEWRGPPEKIYEPD